MVMGVSSYTGKSGRRRRRLRFLWEKRFLPVKRLLQGLTAPAGDLARGALGRLPGLARLDLKKIGAVCRPLATVGVVVHLVLIALYPSGGNGLLGTAPGPGPGYLTPFRLGDALGYDTLHGRDGFLLFKIFTQNGGVVQGAYPDDAVLPRLRYDRWAAAGHTASGHYPRLHALLLRQILAGLPSPPVRLELYSARYRWDRDSLTFPWPGKGPVTALELRTLGVYDGFTRNWRPASLRASRR